jgi:hypothetical protein
LRVRDRQHAGQAEQQKEATGAHGLSGR